MATNGMYFLWYAAGEEGEGGVVHCACAASCTLLLPDIHNRVNVNNHIAVCSLMRNRNSRKKGNTYSGGGGGGTKISMKNFLFKRYIKYRALEKKQKLKKR
jgi:hypothetical protein